MNYRMAVRFPIMICVILALLGALWAALMRVGWQLPRRWCKVYFIFGAAFSLLLADHIRAVG
jgi:hypothetical protein